MAIAVVQSAQATAGAHAVTGGSVTSGNLLVVFYSDNSSSSASISDTLGTTYNMISNTANAVRIYMFWGLAPSSGANTITITATSSGLNPDLAFAELSGASSDIDTWRIVPNDFHNYKLITSHHQVGVLSYIGCNHTSLTFTHSVTQVLQYIDGAAGTTDAAVLGYQFANGAGLQAIDLVEAGSHTDNMAFLVGFLPASAGAAMLPAPRQGNSAAAQSVAFKQNVLSGSMIVVCFGNNTAGTPTVSDTLGTTFTYFGTAGASGNHGHVWYGVTTAAGANTVTIAGSWSFPCIAVAEILNATTIDVSTTGTVGTAYSVTTTQGHDILLTMFASNHGQTYTEGTAGFRLTFTTSSDTICLGCQLGGSAAATETSVITTTNSDNGAFFIAWKSTASYTPPPPPPGSFTINPILGVDTITGFVG